MFPFFLIATTFYCSTVLSLPLFSNVSRFSICLLSFDLLFHDSLVRTLLLVFLNFTLRARVLLWYTGEVLVSFSIIFDESP